MKTKLRAWLLPNRGLAIAFGVVSIVILGYSYLPLDGPRVSWRERFTPAEPKEPANAFANPGDFSNLPGMDHDGGQFIVSPDGRAILTIFHDQAKIRDVATGRVVELKSGGPESSPRPQMEKASFLAGSRFLAGLIHENDESEEGPISLKVFEVPSGRERAGFTGLVDGSKWPAFVVSRDGSTLAFVMGQPGPPTVGVWNLLEDRPPAYFAGKGPIALSGDGRTLALIESTGSDANLTVWDVASTERLSTVAVTETTEKEALAFSPDGKTLAQVWDSKVNLRDVATSSIKLVLSTNLEGFDPWFSPDGSLFFMGSREWDYAPPIEVWDLTINPPRRVFYGHCLNISLDGHRMAQQGPNFVDHPELENTLQTHPPQRVVELPSLRPLGRDLEPKTLMVTLNPDGRLAALIVSRLEPSWARRLANWLPPGFRPAASSFQQFKYASEVRVIDVDSGNSLTTVDLHEKSINFDGIGRTGFVEDGKTLVLHRWMSPEDPSAPGYDDLVELWDVPGPTSKWPLLGGLSVLALVIGRRIDVRARRRAVSAPLST